MRERRGLAVGMLAMLLLATACSSPVPYSPTPKGSSTESGSPSASVPPGTSDQAGLLLNEVLFAPSGSDLAFVEIENLSTGSVDVAGASLRIADQKVPLEKAPSLPAGGFLAVVFDGKDSVEGATIHARGGVGLPGDHGRVELLDTGGQELDVIGWGDGDPAAVADGPGGIVPDTFPQGSSIARAPGTRTRGNPLEWFVSAVATRGEANPAPTVSVMLPISGAVLDVSAEDLFWYPVPGAATYRVEVATEASFATLAMEIETSEPQVNLAPLGPGKYLWRVAAIGADGKASEFSKPSDVELVKATASTVLASYRRGGAGAGGIGLVEDTPGKQLAVPLISQHKDTSMLLLESPVETGAHPWDADHHVLDPHDPADNMNCVLASVAMISKFYGGDLSQDRIGYEMLQRRGGNPPGPEGDLFYGHGMPDTDVAAAFQFALGGATPTGLQTPDELWKTIVAEIDAGRPMAASNAEHAYVVTGYEVTGGRRLISINDPWENQAYRDDVDGGATVQLWLMPAKPTVFRQEAGVTADSDGDGVVDFDETERFQTDPNNKDSDGDQLPDKQDVITGVFDPKWGYAVAGHSPFGRDFDSDGTPTERDKDSDDGGCMDGEEDTSLNGHRDGAETSNFNADDDSCAGWRGTMSVTRKWTYSNGVETGTATTAFSGVFVPDRNPQHYDFECQGDNPPDDCPQIFLATGTITWSFSAQCGDKSDSGSGTFEAGKGFAYPETDWDQQALYLQKTPDGKKFKYWGQGVMVGITDQGEPYCPAGNSTADAERYWFLIEEDAADIEPSGGGIQSCIGHAWEIDVKATTISGTCEAKTSTGETDSVWKWNLMQSKPPAG